VIANFVFSAQKIEFPYKCYDIEFSSETQLVSQEHEIHSYRNYNDNSVHVALIAVKCQWAQAVNRRDHVKFIVYSGCTVVIISLMQM
jgi:hypothetical protein